MKTPRKRFIRTTKRRRRTKKRDKNFLIYMAVCIVLVLIAQVRLPESLPKHVEPGKIQEAETSQSQDPGDTANGPLKYEDVPEYSGSPYVEINGNAPSFTEKDKEVLQTAGYEYYSALDAMGRCGYCEACVGKETMPEGEERGEIWTVHPSGWRSGQGWERCHLIAWALTGENANDHNLVTGSHSLNVDGMLPFEIEVAEAADKGKHVMYRVIPVYKGNEPICRGVQIMGQTIEDNSVSFNIYAYNVEPGKTIDYVSGFMY